MNIKINNQGEDYIAVEINGIEKELHTHDGEAIKTALKLIRGIFKAYA